MARRIYRSTSSNVFGGVCGGVGEYFDLDPNLVRVITVIAFFASWGLVSLAYLAAWIIIPLPDHDYESEPRERRSSDGRPSPFWHRYLPGLLLIGLGLFMLAREYFYWVHFGQFWPFLLILGGVLLIVYSSTRSSDSAPSVGHEHQGKVNSINGNNGEQTS